MIWNRHGAATLGLILAVSLSGAVAAAAATTAPVIKKVGGQYTVELPEAMRQALKTYDPSFTTFSQELVTAALGSSYEYSSRQMPFAIVGDFNGDGIRDVALSGYTKAEPLVLAILSQGGRFKVYEVEKRLVVPGRDPAKFGLAMYLTVVPRGTIVEPDEDVMEGQVTDARRPFTLEADAIQVNIFEKGAVMHYFAGGRFHEHVAGD